jgi:L-cysteine:1D-myo-inositol 2-amino-2-deoxy-alpha-D-glucopyranoside ligase
MRETALFREDMEALRILPAAHYVGAGGVHPAIASKVTDFSSAGGLPPRRRQRRRLLRHLSGARVRVRVQSGPRRDAQFFGERGGDPDRHGKRDALDPLLWRGARDGEPAWDGGSLGPGGRAGTSSAP